MNNYIHRLQREEDLYTTLSRILLYVEANPV